MASNVVSLTFDALVCWLKSVQGFYMILTGSDVITCIMTSWWQHSCVSHWIPAILREIASCGGRWPEKGPPSIAVLHILGSINSCALWSQVRDYNDRYYKNITSRSWRYTPCWLVTSLNHKWADWSRNYHKTAWPPYIPPNLLHPLISSTTTDLY